MKSKKNLSVLFCFIVLLLMTGLGCYFLGKNIESVKNRKEKELNILINRSDLKGLGEIEGTIYVTGHQSPDSDTVCSSIAYASLLQNLGYDAVPVILGEMNHETEYILNAAGLEKPELLEDASGLNMILVDHSEYLQSAEGLEDANIISIIDHHGDGSVTTGNPLIYDARPLGATATIVWIRFRNYGIEPDQQTALVLIGAILSDTRNLQAGTTAAADIEAVKALRVIAGITDKDSYYKEMFKASVSYEGMTDEEILLSDYKEYESGGKKYSIGCINVYDEESAKDMIERMKKTVPSALSSSGMDMSFVQIGIFHDDISVTYLIPSNEAAEEVIRTAFGDRGEFDGSVCRIEPGIGRKKDLVPAITDILESYPKE